LLFLLLLRVSDTAQAGLSMAAPTMLLCYSQLQRSAALGLALATTEGLIEFVLLLSSMMMMMNDDDDDDDDDDDIVVLASLSLVRVPEWSEGRKDEKKEKD
jgi:hypothetical protein